MKGQYILTMKQSLSPGHAIFCHAIFGGFATPDQAILLREISDFDDKKRMLECQEVRWTNLAKNKEITTSQTWCLFTKKVGKTNCLLL